MENNKKLYLFCSSSLESLGCNTHFPLSINTLTSSSKSMLGSVEDLEPPLPILGLCTCECIPPLEVNNKGQRSNIYLG